MTELRGEFDQVRGRDLLDVAEKKRRYIEDSLMMAAKEIPELATAPKPRMQQALEDDTVVVTACSFSMPTFATDGEFIFGIIKNKVAAEEVRMAEGYKAVHAAAEKANVAVEIVERGKLSNQLKETDPKEAMVVIIPARPYAQSSDAGIHHKKNEPVVKPPRGMKSGGWPVEQG